VTASWEVGKGIRLAGPHNGVKERANRQWGSREAQVPVDGVYWPDLSGENFLDVSDTKPAAFHLMALIGRIV